MGVRDQLNQKGKLGMGVAAAIFIIAIGLISFQLRGTEYGVLAQTQAFYTDDNGKTFFKDDINRVSPFDRNGRKAYRADVFESADGKQFVGLIYRHTDIGRREMEEYISRKTKDPEGAFRAAIEMRGLQVKPLVADEKAWQLIDDATVDRLRAAVKGPQGKPAKLVGA